MKIGIDYVGISTPFYCHDGKGNFLFHKRGRDCRDERGHWDTGGGKLDFGLIPEENVLKEVFEEYGCKGEIDECLPVLNIFREQDGIKTHWIALPFFVKVNPEEVKINEQEKIAEIGWFRLDNLPEPLHTGFQLGFAKFRGQFERHGRNLIP